MGLTWIDHPYIDKPVEQLVGKRGPIKTIRFTTRTFSMRDVVSESGSIKDIQKLPLIVTDLGSSNQMASPPHSSL